MARIAQTSVDAALERVEEFLRQWDLPHSHKTDDIYGVHFDPDAEMANLYASDLRAITQTLRLVESLAKATRQTPEQKG
jgi:hypothetical protein